MLKKFSDRIYYLPCSEETDRPNLYYIKGDEKSLAVDAGNSPAHLKLFYEGIAELGFQKPDYTVITHWHWDHCFGICAVDGPVYATEMTVGELEYVSTWEWTYEKMHEREKNCEDIPFCNENIIKEYSELTDIKVELPNVIVREKTVIDLGGVSCILEPHDSTHSRDSLFIHIPQERVLIIGDADCGDFYDNDGRYDREKLINMTDYMLSFDVDYYLIGHDDVQTRGEEEAYLKEELEKLNSSNFSAE
jgi:glyoxylase-like metal-dependent hydrolase (beta-lactamase superfamily II)